MPGSATPQDSSTAWWQELRCHFPLFRERAYFFTGAQAPLATDVREAFERFLTLWDEQVWRFEPAGWEAYDEAQTLLGKILECDPLRIAPTENTSHALNLAARMILSRQSLLDEGPGNVVLHDEVHPAASYAWVNAKRLGAPLELRWPRPEAGEDPADALARSIDEQTCAVIATHVSHLTGERLDVPGLLARFPDRSWGFVLDAAQSAGALPLAAEVQLCDFVAFPAYKWLLGPPGMGFLAAQPDWLEAVGPPFVGWASAKQPLPLDPQHLDLAPGSRAFRLGISNFIVMTGTVAALKLSLSAGQEGIAQRIQQLTDHFLTGLGEIGASTPTPTEWSRRAGIIALQVPEPTRLMNDLLADRLEVGIEEGKIRVDIHAYNTSDELDRLLDRLQTRLSRGLIGEVSDSR